MEFLPDGTIGKGSAGWEKRWDVVDRPQGPVIVISGDAGPVDFIRKEDGTFAGTFPDHKGRGVLIVDTAKSANGGKNGDALPDRPKSPAAIAALKTFEAASEKARSTRTKALSAPLRQLLSELDIAQKDAIKSNDADEAKRIDEWRKYAELNK